MVKISEIGPGIYRLSLFVGPIDLQFNHFLVVDDQPLLYHTGSRGMFPELRDAVATLIKPADLRWIGFSHFESDECGALNLWLAAAPNARPVCTTLGAMVSVNDFSDKPALGMDEGAVLTTGRRRFRMCRTAHLPHGWDAGVLFEETTRTLFCSDLFHHVGDAEPLTESDIVGRSRSALIAYQAGPLADYLPYTPRTAQSL